MYYYDMMWFYRNENKLNLYTQWGKILFTFCVVLMKKQL